jgi:hypothetical protein
MRDVGLELEGVLNAISNPFGNLTRLGRFASRKLGSLLVSPTVLVRSPELEPEAAELGRLIGSLGGSVESLLAKHQKEIVDRQYQLGRIADAATEIYVSSCVLNRLDHLIRHSHDDGHGLIAQLETGRYYLRTARRRIKRSLADLWDNDDESTTSRMLKAWRQAGRLWLLCNLLCRTCGWRLGHRFRADVEDVVRVLDDRGFIAVRMHGRHRSGPASSQTTASRLFRRMRSRKEATNNPFKRMRPALP